MRASPCTVACVAQLCLSRAPGLVSFSRGRESVYKDLDRLHPVTLTEDSLRTRPWERAEPGSLTESRKTLQKQRADVHPVNEPRLMWEVRSMDPDSLMAGVQRVFTTYAKRCAPGAGGLGLGAWWMENGGEGFGAGRHASMCLWSVSRRSVCSVLPALAWPPTAPRRSGELIMHGTAMLYLLAACTGRHVLCALHTLVEQRRGPARLVQLSWPSLGAPG
jgi:hypothetical protein